MKEKDEVLAQILRAADKHPNSRVSKLIRGVVAEESQQNIVLLLIELSEHAEYATDFDISLKYYLDLFERLGVGRDLVLNEAGLLLLSSSKVYSRRVDYVHELVEREILTLSSADQEIEKSKNDEQQAATSAEKPKRGRKRLVEAPNEPYEVEMVPKKIRKLNAEKRFAVVGGHKTKPKATRKRQAETEQYVHPAAWQHGHIIDLENEEEIDSKRNYKLFTYHNEHRYNTLVPDINFRLHFKVKDYIDEEEERMEDDDESVRGECESERGNRTKRRRVWPPLSDAYVKEYLNLENHILAQEQLPQSKHLTLEALNQSKKLGNSLMLDEHFGDADDYVVIGDSAKQPQSAENTAVNKEEDVNETEKISENPALEQVQKLNLSNGAATAECNNTLDVTVLNTSANESTHNDSGLGNSLLDSSNSNNEVGTSISFCETDKSITVVTADIEKNPESTAEPTPLEQVQNLTINTENSTTLACNEDLSTTVDYLNQTTSANDQTTLQNDSALGHSLASTADEGNISASILEQSLNTVDEGNISASILEQSLNTVDEGNISASILEQSFNTTLPENAKATAPSEITVSHEIRNNSGPAIGNRLITSGQVQTSVAEITPTTEKSIDLPENRKKSDENDDTQINLGEIRVFLPHLDDEGVFMSDLDEQEQRMLSPTVMAADMFPSIPNKKNFFIIVDDEIRMLNGIDDDEPETFVMPVQKQPAVTPIVHNIFKFHDKFLKRRSLFKLGPEMDIYLQARSLKSKRTRTVNPREYRHPKMMKLYSLNSTDMTGVIMSPPSSPERSSEEDFCGFSEAGDETDGENDHRLSRDSGWDDVTQVISEELLSATETAETTSNGIVSDDVVKFLDELLEEAAATAVNSEKLQSATKTAETTSNGIVSADVLEFLDELLEDAASTPVESDKLQSANETAETTSNEIVSADVMEFLDELLEDAAATPVNSEKLPSGTETAETTSNGIVSADVLEFLDELLEEAAATPVNSEKNNGTEKAEAVASGTNLTSLAGPNESSKKTEVTIASETIEENSIEPSVLDDNLANIELSYSKTKIQKWHEHLLPILAKSRERHHFDVFEIGTEIIDKLQPDDAQDDFDDDDEHTIQPKCISFQDVMENKDESYVSRYFLSSLLLANQNNIKFIVNNKSSEAPSAWSDVQFELVSTHRHTVAIEDDIGMINTKAQEVVAKNRNKSKTNATVKNTISDDVPCSSSAIATTSMTSIKSKNSSAKVTPINRGDNISTAISTPSQHIKRLALDKDLLNDKKYKQHFPTVFRKVKKIPKPA